jgi:quercetin 2,3-dioxygenase
MFNIIRSEERYHADFGWLETRWHFSFGDYYDPENVNFGALRVFNDDIIQGAGGFGMHPHRDMEIITYVTQGGLAHRDSAGNSGVVHPGEVQVMSAGKGISHSEQNASKTDPLRLMQIWIEPRRRGATPRYEQRQFNPADRASKLLPVVSGGNVPNTLHIDQDATIFVSGLKKDQSVRHESKPDRRQYLFVIDGSVDVNGQKLTAGDQARMVGEKSLDIRASGDSELLLIDLP